MAIRIHLYVGEQRQGGALTDELRRVAQAYKPRRFIRR